MSDKKPKVGTPEFYKGLDNIMVEFGIVSDRKPKTIAETFFDGIFDIYGNGKGSYATIDNYCKEYPLIADYSRKIDSELKDNRTSLVMAIASTEQKSGCSSRILMSDDPDGIPWNKVYIIGTQKDHLWNPNTGHLFVKGRFVAKNSVGTGEYFDAGDYLICSSHNLDVAQQTLQKRRHHVEIDGAYVKYELHLGEEAEVNWILCHNHILYRGINDAVKQLRYEPKTEMLKAMLDIVKRDEEKKKQKAI